MVCFGVKILMNRAIARSTVSQLAKSCFYVSFCVFSTIIDDHDGHQGNTALALTQWWHPVASSEALDVLHWAMGPASYCHIPAWQSKPLAICLHFTFSPILFLAKTRATHCQLRTAKDNVMVKNKPSCHIVYIGVINLLLYYGHPMPLMMDAVLTTIVDGGQAICHNSSSSRIKLQLLYSRPQPQHPQPTLAEEVPCVGLGRFIDPMPWEGQTANHCGDVCC